MEEQNPHMRHERHGGAPDIQELFKKFILSFLKGRTFDDDFNKEASEGQFPDFSCFGDLVLIEMKHLEADQGDRINHTFDEKISPEEKPVFYGSRNISLVIDKASNRSEINAAIFSKLSRTIESILRKANSQFKSYRSRHPRKNAVNICVILNAQLQEYTPEVVLKAVHSKMKENQSREPRFAFIDSIIYISEKHYKTLSDKRIAYAIASYEAVGALNNPWKLQFIEHLLNSWSLFRTGASLEGDNDIHGFHTVQDIPEKMKRYEVWQLEYQRNPYMANISDEQLKIYFHRAIAINSLTFIKGSWTKPSKQETMEGLRRLQHVNEEINRRGIDIRNFSPQTLSSEEKEQIYKDLPSELVSILTK